MFENLTYIILNLVRLVLYQKVCAGKAADGNGGGMDAENVENAVKCIPEFGGIYRLRQLPHVKILSYPVCLIILSNKHWIGIYMTDATVEIIDSIGLVASDGLDFSLCRFLSAQIFNKQFLITPRLQSDNSEQCGKYAVAFLLFRVLTGKTLCDFCQLFSTNLAKNSDIINDIFQTIKSRKDCNDGS